MEGDVAVPTLLSPTAPTAPTHARGVMAFPAATPPAAPAAASPDAAMHTAADHVTCV